MMKQEIAHSPMSYLRYVSPETCILSPACITKNTSTRDIRDETKHQYLLIDTEEAVFEFLNQLGNYKNRMLNENEIVKSILESLMHKTEADLELSYCAMGVVADTLAVSGVFSNSPEEDFKTLASVIVRLGKAIQKQLLYLNAYKNGYLNWKFHTLVGKDMILKKLREDLD